ncbi:MAG: hypothetical protein IJR47_00900, partial [Clostridia bacterium]|nr:hypothetical protein [Clostridia bacterium]
PIKIRYYNAATDANGEKHDIIITFNNFTIKDTNRVPTTQAGGTTISSYRRELLTISPGSLLLSNRAIDRNGNSILSQGSGTFADITVEIDGAPANTTFLFCGDHLNKAHLVVDDYTPGAEGVILGDGFSVADVRMTEDNILKRYSYNGSAWVEDPNGNYIMAGADDLTDINRIRFYTKGDAQGSNFIWTSGMTCDTHLFSPGTAVNTFDPLLPMYLRFKADKKLNGETPESSYNDKFTFKMEANTQTIVNDEINYAVRDGAPTIGTLTYANGVVSISDMKFTTAGTYFYKIKENPGNITGMTYDTTEHDIKIVVDWRKTDADLHEHLKAKIFVDGVEVLGEIKSQQTTDTKSPYNPLATRPTVDTKITFNNNLVLDLEIQNTVRGNIGNKLREFDFKVKVPYLAGKTTMVYVNGGISNWTFDENGEKTFKLKDGESIKIPSLPPGIKYSVAETAVDGYAQRYFIDGFLTPSTDTGDKDFVKTTVVIYENYRNIELPAGILMSFGPAVIGVIIVLIIFGVLILSKKLKNKDENDDE